MTVYDWLRIELAAVRTRNYFLMQGAMWPELTRIQENYGCLPSTYCELLAQFGGLKLFREEYSLYNLIVFNRPRVQEYSGEVFLNVAYSDAKGTVSFKSTSPGKAIEDVVYEGRPLPRATELAFDNWFKKAFKREKSKISKRAWSRIESGPEPFTEKELQILEARRLFRWKRVGVSPNNRVVFEVRNDSELILKTLTLGVRKPGKFEGGVWLPVSKVLPGTVQSIEADCYSELCRPAEVEIYDLPDPGPEERDFLKDLSGVEFPPK